MSELPPVARPNYFDGEALLTADFVCEQRYHMEMLAELNRGLHTWGIARGLDVHWEKAQSSQVHVSPGMAIDGLGREIVLTDPQVIALRDAEAGAAYYITIRYYDAYADFTDQTGVAGFKRVVQQPKIEFTRTVPEDQLNILLAVVSLSSEGAINDLTHRAGSYQRRYVGGRFGQLELVFPGCDVSSDDRRPVTLSAHLEADGAHLAVHARESRFKGDLSVGGYLGIGVENPDACLHVKSTASPGAGYCTSNGTTLVFTEPISPPLRPGDAIVLQIPIGAPRPKRAWGTIAKATEDARCYILEEAFSTDVTSLPYTQRPGVVARISTPVDNSSSNVQDVLRIDRDGTVALGLPATPYSGVGAGAAALQITNDGNVGIGLVEAAQSGARLEVNGNIAASGLSVVGRILAGGAVVAQSFEGNGAKLQNLPILSYWTKVNPGTNESPLFYASGSVCIQTKKPFGALTVGSGRAFVGNGLISCKENSDIVNGQQTQFLDYVNPGDKIIIGRLNPLQVTVAQVVSDTQLIVESQFPVLLLQTKYKIPAVDDHGPGVISSNGTIMVGEKTTFSKHFKPGDLLRIEEFIGEDQSGRMVRNVNSNTELQLFSLTDTSRSTENPNAFQANLSAYMVKPSLIAHFQDGGSLAAGTQPAGEEMPNKPAMIVVSNGISVAASDETTARPSNTVAINYELSDVKPHYALMVNGPTNFSGGGHHDKLTVGDLTVTDKAAIGRSLDQSSAYRLHVADGDMHVDGSISVGGSVSSQAVSAAGDITAKGALSGAALTAAGVNVDDSGQVKLFGHISDLGSSSSFNSFTPTTDGFVIVQIQADAGGSFGTVYCTAGGKLTMVSAATTGWQESLFVFVACPQSNSMTVPVRKGDIVELAFVPGSQGKAATFRYLWVPLGPRFPGTAAGESPVPSSFDPLPDMDVVQLREIRDTVPQKRELAAEVTASTVARFIGALRTIAGTTATEDVVRDLTDGVLALARADRSGDAPAAPGRIDRVVEAGSRLFGTTFTDDQKAMLARDISDLIETGYLEAGALIEHFIDHLQQVLGTTFVDGSRRSLREGLKLMLGLDDDPGQH